MRCMKKLTRQIMAVILIVALMNGGIVFAQESVPVNTSAIELVSPSAILMEASTGTVLFEKNPDEIRSPASITKIMTLLLTFEAIEKGRIRLDDEVTTSA